MGKYNRDNIQSTTSSGWNMCTVVTQEMLYLLKIKNGPFR